MKSIEYLSFVAAAFELTGIFLLGKKNKWGWIVCIGGSISWITYSLLTKSTFGLLLVCSVAFFLNFKGFFNWSKKDI